MSRATRINKGISLYREGKSVNQISKELILNEQERNELCNRIIKIMPKRVKKAKGDRVPNFKHKPRTEDWYFEPVYKFTIKDPEKSIVIKRDHLDDNYQNFIL